MDTEPVEYWDAQARDYDGNIFSTIDEDVTGIITETLDKHADARGEGPFGRCIDLGCGAGKYLAALAARFGTVVGYDLSPKLVRLAQKEVRGKGLRNVEVGVRDLSQVWYRDSSDAAGNLFGDCAEMGSFGFAVMANVLIAPVESGVRTLMLRNAWRSLCPGGRLLAVVPSLESALYVNMRCDETGCEGPYDGGGGRRAAPGCAPTDTMRMPSKAEGADLLRGVIKRSGVRTKHFLEPEFRLLAARTGFEVESCEKVAYTWRSELDLDSDAQVPASLRGAQGGALPWDWLFVLRRPEPAVVG